MNEMISDTTTLTLLAKNESMSLKYILFYLHGMVGYESNFHMI